MMITRLVVHGRDNWPRKSGRCYRNFRLIVHHRARTRLALKKAGFKHGGEDSWGLFQSRVRISIMPGTLFVCGHEVARCLKNHFRSWLKNDRLSIEPVFSGSSVTVDSFTPRLSTDSVGSLGLPLVTYRPLSLLTMSR